MSTLHLIIICITAMAIAAIAGATIGTSGTRRSGYGRIYYQSD